MERDNRWLKWGFTLTGVVLIVGLIISTKFTKFQSAPAMSRIIEAERLIIKDAAGKTRAVVGRDENAVVPNHYGIFIYSEDGESEAGLTDWNLHIYHDYGSANFSPLSVDISQYKIKASQLFREVSRLPDKRAKQELTKQEPADFEPVAKLYVNMTGPYLEVKKRHDGQEYSGAGEVQVGVVPYPSVSLRSSEDKTSFSLSALKGTAGFTMRDSQGKKRASLDVDFSDGASMNLYDKDGKTVRATFGNVTLQTIRTGGIQQRPASSLVLFDKDGKVLWSTPQN